MIAYPAASCKMDSAAEKGFQKVLIVRFIVLIPLYTVVANKTKEASTMKHTTNSSALTVCKPRTPMYPGAADDRYFADKALDILTAIVSGMGMITAMLFLLTLS